MNNDMKDRKNRASRFVARKRKTEKRATRDRKQQQRMKANARWAQ